MLENGSVMQLLTGSPPADVSVAPIFLWWEPDVRPSKLGALHFNHDVENKQKTKVEGQSLPLNKISDVFSVRPHTGCCWWPSSALRRMC
jgi:hypothetical protein